MAAFVPYIETTILPGPGAFEFDTLDFKGTVLEKDGSIDRLELAKDLAAFANAHGGTILVGAYEDAKRGHLGKLDGLKDDTSVKEIRKAYSEAARNHCRPSPVTNSVVLPYSTGKLVGVNVSPFPGQAVGIRVDADTWRFPVRRSIDTIFFTPEQIAMLMLPELRRTVALLRSVAPTEPIMIAHRTSIRSTRYLTLLSEEENIVVFSKKPGGKEAFRVPLDRIAHVWKSKSSSWQIDFKQL